MRKSIKSHPVRCGSTLHKALVNCRRREGRGESSQKRHWSLFRKKAKLQAVSEHLLDGPLPIYHQGRRHHHEFMVAQSWLPVRSHPGRLPHDNETHKRLKGLTKTAKLF